MNVLNQYPENSNKKWSIDDDGLLVELYCYKNISRQKISERLNRSERSITDRIRKKQLKREFFINKPQKNTNCVVTNINKQTHNKIFEFNSYMTYIQNALDITFETEL